MYYNTKNTVKVNLDIVECHFRSSLHVLWMGEITKNLIFCKTSDRLLWTQEWTFIPIVGG